MGIEPTLPQRSLINSNLGFSASLMASLPLVTLPVLLPAIRVQAESLPSEISRGLRASRLKFQNPCVRSPPAPGFGFVLIAPPR